MSGSAEEAQALVLGTASDIRIEIRAPAAEMRWLRPLFLRNKDPFKVLLEVGFEVAASHHETVEEQP